MILAMADIVRDCDDKSVAAKKELKETALSGGQQGHSTDVPGHYRRQVGA